MAAFSGEKLSVPSITEGSQSGSGHIMSIALAGSGINPFPYYSLACFDTSSVRHYWTDNTVQMANAPAIIGGATYVTATLVILSKY